MHKKQIIIGIIVAVVLTAGLVVGDYLVKRQQRLEKKAAVDIAGNLTVEALLKDPVSGATSRLTTVNARTIVHYDVSPRVDYKSCMSGGYMSLPIRSADNPCTAVGQGSYATKWDRQVTVGSQNYKLVYPTTCVGEKIDGVEVCEQTENIRPNVGAPYHRGIYQLMVSASPSPLPSPSPTPTPTPTLHPTPTPTPTPQPTPSPTPTPTPTPTPRATPIPTPTSVVTASPTPTPLSQLPQTGSATGTWIITGVGGMLLLLGTLAIFAL